MERHLQTVLFTIIGLFVAAGTPAATWTVERNGSGDFIVVQDAVDASASGDTILIGPGRYPELHSYTTPSGGWTGDVLVSIDDRDLTLIGAGQGVTIIGLEEYPGTPLWPKGVVAVWPERTLVVESMTIENVYEGIYLLGAAAVHDVTMRGGRLGLVSFESSNVIVDGCRFENIGTNGITAFSGTTSLHVHDTSFDGIERAVSTNNVGDVLVQGCSFQNLIGGGGFHYGSTVVVQECVFTDMHYYGVSSGYSSHMEVIDCTIEGGIKASIISTESSYVSGSGNILSSLAGPTIRVSYHSDIELHGNHILSPTNNFVELDDYFLPETYYLDLTNNYWGDTTAAEISAGIWDGHDDPEINAFVLFNPFSGSPISNEDMSWGELKQLYSR